MVVLHMGHFISTLAALPGGRLGVSGRRGLGVRRVELPPPEDLYE